MNFISRIKDATGHWIKDREGIRASAADFFKSLFSSDREERAQPLLDFPVPKLTLLDNSDFHQLPTMEELKEAVFSMSQDSAPGPDGFSSGFYQGIEPSQRCGSELGENLQCFSVGQTRKGEGYSLEVLGEGVHPIVVQVARLPMSWRRLEKVRAVAESKIRWCLGRGFVDFWFDRWLSDRPLAEMVQLSDYPHMLLAEFHREEGWKGGRLASWLPPYLVQQILQVQLFPDQDDDMVWGDSSSGGFALKTAWAAVRQRGNVSSIDSRIWSGLIPLKISFFVWKVLRRMVPVDTILQNRGFSLASCCVCCSAHPESLSHLLIDGPVATQVWEHFLKRFGIVGPRPRSVAAMCLAWFLSSSCMGREHIRVLLPCAVLWFLWKGRNRARFDGETFSARGVICMVEKFMVQLGRAKNFQSEHFRGDSEDPWRSLFSPRRKKVGVLPVSWKWPPFQYVKLNTDASVVHGRGAGGGLLRDHEGKVIFAFYKEFGETDVLTAESLALLHGLRLCSIAFKGRLLVEADSLTLVNLVNTRHFARSGS
nr:uncharacterized protein LOC113710068 [Coffea arabica]